MTRFEGVEGAGYEGLGVDVRTEGMSLVEESVALVEEGSSGR